MGRESELHPNIPDSLELRAFMSGYFLRAWDEAGMGSWDVSWRVDGLTVSGRYGWRSLQLDAILETSGKCSLRELRSKLLEEKTILLSSAL